MWVFSRYIRFSTFRCALKNRQFWPFLTNFSGKIRSDSKSAAFFTSICIAPNIFSAFILCFPERYEFALDVLFTHRLVLVALYNQWNKWCRQFANIHIDVKFFEEAESGLILSKNWPKSKKKEFFKICSFFNISICFEKLSILTTFDQLFRRNKVRFEILSIFYVDMY